MVTQQSGFNSQLICTNKAIGQINRQARPLVTSEGEFSPTPVRFWELADQLHNAVAILSAVMASIMDVFQQTGAYLHGHFRLTSGLHSAEYLQCAKVLAHPLHAGRMGAELAHKLKELTGHAAVDAVVSPAMGGIIIGHETAKALNVLSLFTERDAGTNEMTLRRGFEITPGQRVIIVEDVITTGGSTREVATLLSSMGANVLAAGSIIDRSGGVADVGVPRVSLETLTAIAYPPEDCPLCKQGLPVVKPGSRRT